MVVVNVNKKYIILIFALIAVSVGYAVFINDIKTNLSTVFKLFIYPLFVFVISYMLLKNTNSFKVLKSFFSSLIIILVFESISAYSYSVKTGVSIYNDLETMAVFKVILMVQVTVIIISSVIMRVVEKHIGISTNKKKDNT